MSDLVISEDRGPVRHVVLNRPEKANAFDPDMCEELLEALRMLAAADQVRVIVITGAGKAFCAGADLGVLGTQGGAGGKHELAVERVALLRAVEDDVTDRAAVLGDDEV